ncbi:sulfotransferase [Bradyrhizobium iriomotense]|uniref:sulfotransferase n=1 Tax=Bradyrhizobium iriomotense TaxID=441950 RepID=UPI001B8A5EC1|nr:sulfotransferase [Bradyrhizobium iriomotense]MBR1133263.1 sulfotransferase [Bradyrhizobium iriomotense]
MMSRAPNPSLQVAFLLGLPRSGTTLLAHLLQQHPDLLAPPEPWLMLALAALGEVDRRHPADARLVGMATGEFFDRIDRIAACRALADAAYNQYLATAGKRCFIDKTPRYWMALNFIDALYPEASQIILLRNPYSIAASLKSTWHISLLPESCPAAHAAYLADLVLGLPVLAARLDHPETQTVRYEALVRQPAEEVRRLVAALGYDPDGIRSTTTDNTGYLRSGNFGDRKILDKKAVDDRSIDAWRSELTVAEMQSVTDMVGTELLVALGYEQELQNAQDAGVVDKGKDATRRHREVFEAWWNVRGGGKVTAVGSERQAARQMDSKSYLSARDSSVLRGAKTSLNLPLNFHDAFELAEVTELKRNQQALLDEREHILEVNQRLASELREVEADRAAKSEVTDRLASEIAQLKRNHEALQKEREDALAVNQRLAIELHAVDLDRKDKSAVIDRLSAKFTELERDRDALRKDREHLLEVNQTLATELSTIESDRADKLRSIDRLASELEEVAMRDAIQRRKLAAKEHVIESIAARELERQALLKGGADLLYHSRRGHTPPGYGDFFPPENPASGMHVAIDALEIVFGVSGGVETYMKMLTNALLKGGRRVTLICLPDQLPAMRKLFHARVGYFVMRKSRAIGLAIEISNRLLGQERRLSAASSMATFSRLRDDIGADVLHSPVQIFSKPDFRIPSVLNLHDLQHLHFPENFNPSDIEARKRLYGLSASLADAIVVSSDFVRNDLINRMEIPAAKIFTVPVTWDPMVIEGLEKFSPQDAIAHYKLPPTYVIYPAQFWPHKNHARLVQALRIVRDKRPGTDLKLLFTGYRGHSGWPTVRAAIQELGLEPDVICLDHVPVDHLAALYKGALYCVMPSTFEASSYPVIEAQVLGVPAMCSNVTSLPELMRNGAGLLFDPFDVEDIAAKMMHWLDDTQDRQAHAERGRLKACQEHSLERYIAGLARAYDYALAARKLPDRSGLSEPPPTEHRFCVAS